MIQEGKVVCSTGEPCDDELVGTILGNCDATILTVSKRGANRINDLVFNSILWSVCLCIVTLNSHFKSL